MVAVRNVIRAVALALAALLMTPAGPALPQEGVQAAPRIDQLSSRFGPLSTIEMAVRVAEATPGTSARVVIGRDDVFADALASGPLQQDGPLLLVPSTGPVPDRVRREIMRRSATSAVILGGEAAVAPAVAEELVAMGLSVSRLAGGSRLETATAIAAQGAPAATEALLVRAFPSEGAAQSQGFADSLGAGALAATAGLPILLTQTDQLSQATADYLTGSTVSNVLIVGGTAAVSAEVEADIQGLGMTTERIAGPSRFATGVEVARQTESRMDGPVQRLVLASAEGDDAWAPGFAAAHHAAMTGGVVVFARDPGDVPPAPPGQLFSEPLSLPEETLDYLDGAAFAGPTDLPALTCTALPGACESLRTAAGFPPTPRYTIDPPSFGGDCLPRCEGAPGVVAEDTTVRITVPAGAPTPTVTSSCGDIDDLAVRLRAFRSGGCWLRITEPSTGFHEDLAYLDERTIEGTLDRPLALSPPVLISTDPTSGQAAGVDVQEPFVASDDGSTLAWSMTNRCTADAPQPISPQVCVQRDGQRIQLGLTADGTFVTAPTQVRSLSEDGSTVVYRGPPGLTDHEQTTGGTSCCLYATDLDTGQTEVVSIDAAGDDLRSWEAGRGAVHAYDGGNKVLVVGRGAAEPGGPVSPASLLFLRIRDEERTIVLRRPDGEPLQLGAVRVTRVDVQRDRAFAWTPGTAGRPQFVQIDLATGEVELTGIGLGDEAGAIPWAGGTGFGDASADLEVRVQEGFADGTVDGQTLMPNQTYVLGTADAPDGTAQRLAGVAQNVLGGPVVNARNVRVSASGGFVTFNAPSSATPEQQVNAGFPRTGCGLWTTDLGSGQTIRADQPDGDGRYGTSCSGANWVGDDGTTCTVTNTAMDPQADTNSAADLYCIPELQETLFDIALDRLVPL